MSIEGILRRKGTEVTTIAPEASTKSAVDDCQLAGEADMGSSARDLCCYLSFAWNRCDGNAVHKNAAK